MHLETAIDVIESVSGFDDPTSSVGEAWQTVLDHITPHVRDSFDSYLLKKLEDKNKQFKEALAEIADHDIDTINSF